MALEKARKCWVSVPGFKFVVLNNLEDRRAAVSASARMRATIDFRPFERCGVRCSRKPSRSNRADGSIARMSRAALVGIQGEQDRDQPAHDMGVAVAAKREDRSAGAVRPHGGGKPDLAGAALHLVCVGMRLGRKRGERAAELDDVPIAVVPFVEQGEVVADLVDRHGAHGSAAPPIGPPAPDT